MKSGSAEGASRANARNNLIFEQGAVSLGSKEHSRCLKEQYSSTYHEHFPEKVQPKSSHLFAWLVTVCSRYPVHVPSRALLHGAGMEHGFIPWQAPPGVSKFQLGPGLGG